MVVPHSNRWSVTKQEVAFCCDPAVCTTFHHVSKLLTAGYSCVRQFGGISGAGLGVVPWEHGRYKVSKSSTPCSMHPLPLRANRAIQGDNSSGHDQCRLHGLKQVGRITPLGDDAKMVRSRRAMSFAAS